MRRLPRVTEAPEGHHRTTLLAPRHAPPGCRVAHPGWGVLLYVSVNGIWHLMPIAYGQGDHVKYVSSVDVAG